MPHPDAEIKWDKGIALLKIFKDRVGHADVPNKHEEDGFKLGIWLQNQRVAGRKGEMELAKRRKLDSLNIVWDPLEAQWERGCELLFLYKEREGDCDVPRKHEEDGSKLGNWLSNQRVAQKKGELSAERRTRLENLGVTWDLIEAQWDKCCDLVQAFREREGHSEVPRKHEEGDMKLGNWLKNQRTAAKKGELTLERRQRLEGLGVSLHLLVEAGWGRDCDLLARFREREGHADVPTRHEEEGTKLGMWLKNQRAAAARGELSADQKQRLEALGVSWGAASKAHWEKSCAALSTYQRREKSVEVPAAHEEDGIQLGIWLQNQLGAAKKGELTTEQRRRLEALGVECGGGTRHQLKWEAGYDMLKEFREREGHADVPVRHNEGNAKLGSWLSNQRVACKKKELSAERKARLDALGVVWDPLAEAWDRGFEQLESFKNREGHADVPRTHEEEGGSCKLGTWLHHQRTAFKKDELTPEQKAKLETLGVVWDKHAHQWEKGCRLLGAFRDREGHVDVPHKHEEEDMKLGNWLTAKRTAAKKGELSSGRRQKLEGLGVVFESDTQWERGCELIAAYKTREGHCEVPKAHEEDGIKLGNWLKMQKGAAKKGKLPPEKKQRLEDLGVI